MKYPITCSKNTGLFRYLCVIALVFQLSLSTQLFAQCSGFFLNVDTDPPYLNYCPGDTVIAFPIITGGTWPFTYAWSTGGTDSIEVLEALETGWYNACVTVTDAIGCVAYGCKHIKPTFWNLGIYSGGAECEGDAISLSVNASSPDNTLLWSTGETGNPISVTEPGTYTVTVTESTLGCTQVLEITPEFYPNPIPEITGPVDICNGQTATLEVLDANQYYDFAWFPSGESTSTIEIGDAGTYIVTVTDNLGCTGTAEIVVESLSGTLPQIDAPTQLCSEDVGIIEVTNTGELVSFLWSTGETSSSINGVAPETYFVTVTDMNGCEESGEITIELFEVVDPIILGDSELCVGQESDTLTVFQIYSQYEWSTGEATQSVIVSEPGLYTVTVIDANGCATTGEHTLIAAPIPDPNIIAPPLSCENVPALLYVTGSGGPYVSFLWSPNGETSSEIVVEESGTYSVLVTNAYGCTGAAFEDPIYVGDGPTATIVAESSGCAEPWILTASGGEYYHWSTGETAASIVVETDGTIVVTVTDVNGCTDTEIQIVTISNELQVDVSGPSVICEADTIVLKASPGFAEYVWTDGLTSAEITISQPGTYAVTVTDDSGCSGADSLTISAAPAPIPQISGPLGFCSDDSATLSLNEDFVEILWSNGESTQSITVADPDTYSVVVTNAFGCTATSEMPIGEFPAPAVDIAGPASICTGSATSLAVSGSYSSIVWSTGETTKEIIISGNGTYEVTVTDSNGCTATDLHLVAIGDSLSPVITVNAQPCADTISLDAGAGYESYLWSNDATTSSISVTSSGTYSVTVSDANGCAGESETSISMNYGPELSISGPSSSCEGNSSILVASPGFSAYSWSNGETTDSISISESGTYTVLVTDANGCTGSASLSFESFPAPTVEIVGPGSICTGGSTTLAVTGEYNEIHWNTGATTPDIIVSGSGSYEVVVTDSNGCTATDLHVMETSDSLNPVITLSGPVCNDSITLDAGVGYDQYLWSNDSVTSTITVTSSGTYTVTVSDASGCSGTDISVITIPETPFVNITGPNSACDGTVATLMATAGFASYLWSNGAMTDSIIVSETGSYSVVVTDANGCTASASQSFEFLPSPDVQISGPGFNCSGDTTNIFISGSFSQVIWSTGEATSSIDISQGGEYSVVVTDINGCTATSEYLVVDVQADRTFVQMETCSVLDTGTVEVLMVNQNGCDSVVTIHTGLTPSLNMDIALTACVGGFAIFNEVPIAAGTTRQFAYMAANGCDSVVTVTVDELPQVFFDLTTRETCPNELDGLIHIHAQGGTAPYLFSLDGNQPQVDSVFSGLPSGFHTVVVADASGCGFEEIIEISESTLIELTFEEGELNCENNVVILEPVVVSGDVSQVNWEWEDGSTQPWLLAESPGNYTVQVDDGCGTQEFTIGVDWSPEINDRNFFYIPNAFTPNNDGINDLFQAFASPDLAILTFEFRIFDRWGNLMFGTNNTDDGWDGIFNGSPMQPGVYVWYIKAKGEVCGMRDFDVLKKGDVTIVR